MCEFLWRLIMNSDGLVVGFGIGLIVGGLFCSAIAYEAGRRRQHREQQERDEAAEADALLLVGQMAPIVPRWPRDAA